MNTQNNKNERKIINRLNDAFFKNLFGRPGHEKYLISLLNSMFESVLKGRRIVINTLYYLIVKSIRLQTTAKPAVWI